MKTIVFYGYVMICISLILQCVFSHSAEKQNHNIQNNTYEQCEPFEPFEVHAGKNEVHAGKMEAQDTKEYTMAVFFHEFYVDPAVRLAFVLACIISVFACIISVCRLIMKAF